MWWPHCHATWKGSVAVAGERHSTWKEMRAILIDLFPLWHRDGRWRRSWFNAVHCHKQEVSNRYRTIVSLEQPARTGRRRTDGLPASDTNDIRYQR